MVTIIVVTVIITILVIVGYSYKEYKNTITDKSVGPKNESDEINARLDELQQQQKQEKLKMAEDLSQKSALFQKAFDKSKNKKLQEADRTVIEQGSTPLKQPEQEIVDRPKVITVPKSKPIITEPIEEPVLEEPVFDEPEIEEPSFEDPALDPAEPEVLQVKKEVKSVTAEKTAKNFNPILKELMSKAVA